ncbi:MAG: response regulator [bacterium]|nr:response regulator [bacterium]
MSILIAEDDVTSAKIIEIILKKYGFKYHLAENGKIALNYLLANPQVTLLISDIMMPEMDGLQLLAKIRSTRELKNTPAIMCTTKSDVATVKTAVKSGCVDYVVKPLNPLQLLRKIENILDKAPPIILDYRDLVTRTPIDRSTYSDIVKEFRSRLDSKITLLSQHLSKMELLPADELEDFTENCREIGALRLFKQLEESAKVLASDISKEEKLLELRLIKREMEMLEYYLP